MKVGTDSARRKIEWRRREKDRGKITGEKREGEEEGEIGRDGERRERGKERERERKRGRGKE